VGLHKKLQADLAEIVTKG